jgi:hypothetical protein
MASQSVACCNQAITRFDRRSLSDTAMFRQLSGTGLLKNIENQLKEHNSPEEGPKPLSVMFRRG